MIFAQFFHDSTGWNGRDFSGPVSLIPACGSDSVLLIDGRFSRANAAAYARKIAAARGWKGFTLNAGDSFSQARETRGLETL